MNDPQLLRRKPAGDYLKEKFGVGSAATLAKLATLGGGPEIVYIGRIPLYTKARLDSWAIGRISGPVRNTSEAQLARHKASSNEAREVS